MSARASNNTVVTYTVGNTYQKIPELRARMDRTRKHKKVHDWLLYLDILEGNPDHIQRVTFDLGASFQPRAFTCVCTYCVRMCVLLGEDSLLQFTLITIFIIPCLCLHYYYFGQAPFP